MYLLVNLVKCEADWALDNAPNSCGVSTQSNSKGLAHLLCARLYLQKSSSEQFFLSCQLFGLLTLSLQQQEFLFAYMMTLSASHWSLFQNPPPFLFLCMSLLCVSEYMVGANDLDPHS